MSSESADWERIEADYRAGILSLREIAANDGNVTEGAIRKRAKRDAWARDLNAKIQARADELVRKQAVRAEVRGTQSETERTVIEANAQRIADVRGEHRADISQARALALTLLGELKAQTSNQEPLEQLFELLTDPEAEGEDSNAAARERQRKRREAFERVMSLGGRVKTMKDLADTLKTLITLEREAYGLAGEKGAGEAPPPAMPLPNNHMAREIARALQLGLKTAANDPQTVPPRQAAS